MCVLGNREDVFKADGPQPEVLTIEGRPTEFPVSSIEEVLILGFHCPECTSEHMLLVHSLDDMQRYFDGLDIMGPKPAWYRSTLQDIESGLVAIAARRRREDQLIEELASALAGLFGGGSAGGGSYGMPGSLAGFGGMPAGRSGFGNSGGMPVSIIIGGGDPYDDDDLAGLLDELAAS